MSDDPNPSVRYDLGGWISGPMMDLEPTLDDVKRAFPDWTVYKGTDQLWHARRADASPPANVVTGEDLLDLADMIKREQTKGKRPAVAPTDARPPASWPLPG